MAVNMNYLIDNLIGQVRDKFGKSKPKLYSEFLRISEVYIKRPKIILKSLAPDESLRYEFLLHDFLYKDKLEKFFNVLSKYPYSSKLQKKTEQLINSRENAADFGLRQFRAEKSKPKIEITIPKMVSPVDKLIGSEYELPN